MQLYDNVRNQNEKLRAQVEQLTIERDQAIKDLREALFIKAEHIQRTRHKQAKARLDLQSKNVNRLYYKRIKAKAKGMTIKYKGNIMFLKITPK